MKTPAELNQNIIKFNNEQVNESLSHIVPLLLIVEDYIDKASKIGRYYTYIHLEHRSPKSKKIALNIIYDYLEKKEYRVDRVKNIISWSTTTPTINK